MIERAKPAMLKIVTWNCCRGRPEAKLPHIADLRPDVACVQEIARPIRPERASVIWCGDNHHQGLMVMARDKFRLVRVGRKPIRAKHFLPVQIDGPAKFNLLGAWAKPAERRPLYVTTLFRGLAAYRDFLQSSPTILIGDLNTENFLSADDPHLKLVEVLRREFELVSAYHEYFGEQHGLESRHTYFDRTKQGRPYHIDYCFIPISWLPNLQSVAVGTRRRFGRVSDHVPLILEFKL